MSTPMLNAQKWIVVGDVLNPSKPAHTIVQHLSQRQRHVYPINPRLKDADLPSLIHSHEGKSEFEHAVSNSLGSAEGKGVEVLDLCIAPTVGLGIVQQAKALGVSKVFIQPGAESEDILQWCRQNDVEVHQGCVLREMP